MTIGDVTEEDLLRLKDKLRKAVNDFLDCPTSSRQGAVDDIMYQYRNDFVYNVTKTNKHN